MSIITMAKAFLPTAASRYLRERFHLQSKSRRESNKWLLKTCRDIQGHVLSIGSGDNTGETEDYYKHFFPSALSYTTSEVSDKFQCDLTLDIRAMSTVKDESYDCIYCSGVLEHVDNYIDGLKELTRILKTGGTLLLGLPFRQAVHMAPHDFWRFTEHGIRHLLKESYDIVNFAAIDAKRGMEFPTAYWVRAVKLKSPPCSTE